MSRSVLCYRKEGAEHSYCYIMAVYCFHLKLERKSVVSLKGL